MHSLSRRDLALLVALTLAWGLNWPIMKFGVQDLAPLYYRVLCIAGGLVLLWLYARHAGIDLFVPRSAWPQVVKLAVPNLVSTASVFARGGAYASLIGTGATVQSAVATIPAVTRGEHDHQNAQRANRPGQYECCFHCQSSSGSQAISR